MPHPHSTSGTSGSPPAFPSQPIAPGNTVVLWDRQIIRCKKVQERLQRVGLACVVLGDLARLPAEQPGGGQSLAWVALSSEAGPEELSLEAIAALCHHGHTVYAYEDGICSWPVAQRCRVLLAGARDLLDSRAPGWLDWLVERTLQTLSAQARRFEETQELRRQFAGMGIVGQSRALLGACQAVRRASRLSDLPVLLTGETGTGKELFSRAIHRLDAKRNRGPFIAVNCAALTRSLMEAEFFGHRRGAFTGAVESRRGLFRAADGGVLFLDEVSELDDALQAKLLRVLQEGRVMGVGEDREIPVDVRVVAATNRDLATLAQQGKFREDLFHRLHVLPVHIPPLRERREDVPVLVQHFLEKYAAAYGGVPQAAPDFLEALNESNLGGNGRELENLVRQALAFREGDAPLRLADLPPELLRSLSSPAPPETAGGVMPSVTTNEISAAGTPARALPLTPGSLSRGLVRVLEANAWSLPRALHHCEKLLLEATLHIAHGNQSQTARLLGITPRSVYNKLRKHKLAG